MMYLVGVASAVRRISLGVVSRRRIVATRTTPSPSVPKMLLVLRSEAAQYVHAKDLRIREAVAKRFPMLEQVGVSKLTRDFLRTVQVLISPIFVHPHVDESNRLELLTNLELICMSARSGADKRACEKLFEFYGIPCTLTNSSADGSR